MPGKHTGVQRGFGVAGGAIGGCAFEDVVFVTVGAGHIGMSAFQLEGRQVVVKGGVFPVFGGVAGGAIGAKLTVVMVVFGVAVNALAGCAFEEVVFMAVITGHVGVFPFQLESGKVMVKGGRFPGFGRVAGGAISAKLTVVRVVFGVAVGAVSLSVFEIGASPRPAVTLGAAQFGVFPSQVEIGLTMVEAAPQAFRPVVAGQAIFTIFDAVRLHEGGVFLPVTIAADGGCEAGNVVAVTVFAGEGLRVGLVFVRGKGKPGAFMREGGRIHQRGGRVWAAMVRVTVAAGQALA